MTDELRVGIVGAGLIAGVHADAYAATPGVVVTVVTDPVTDKAKRLADRIGGRAVASLDELLDDGVDVVCICTPPHAHAAPAVRAIKAGRHVFCEKPLAGRLDDARQIVAAARSTNAVVMVGHVSRFEADHRLAKDLVAAGQLGRIAMMSHSTTTSLPGWSEGGWLAQAELSGGPIVDQGVHSFDYLGWLADSPAVRVHAIGADSVAGPSTYAVATVRYASGAIGRVETSWAHPADRGFKLSSELVGTEGRLSWDSGHIIGGVMYVTGGPTEWFDPIGDRGYRAEMAAFVDAARSGGPSPVPVECGYEALRVALAARESIRTREPIDLTAWEPL